MVDHRANVYGAVTRVPLVIAAPNVLKPSQVVTTPVQLGDVGDTLLELAGVDGPFKRSLVPVIHGQERQGPIVSMAWADPYRAATIGGRFLLDWKLFRVGDSALVFSSEGDLELYDVSVDPLMLNDIAKENMELVADLKSQSDGTFAISVETPAETVDSQTKSNLKALGYIQ